MELIVLWLLCGILGAAMLSGYNKAGTGFLLGLLLGPFGLLFALLIRSNAKSAEEKKKHEEQIEAMTSKSTNSESTDQSDTKECPFCAETIKKKAKFCRYCNKELSESAAT